MHDPAHPQSSRNYHTSCGAKVLTIHSVKNRSLQVMIGIYLLLLMEEILQRLLSSKYFCTRHKLNPKTQNPKPKTFNPKP